MAAELDFRRLTLSDQFYSEGGAIGDFNGDGVGDVVVGPWIYWGPDMQQKSQFYVGDAIDPLGYSKNFLMYAFDINGDQAVDICVIGFPGEASWWYENPNDPSAVTQPWKQHTMLDVVDNESPAMVDIDGDGNVDLICSSQGCYGYATHAGQDPTSTWTFVKIGPNKGYHRFTHGLGVGDVNNDGHQDLLEKDGWWENPGRDAKQLLAEQPLWQFHPFAFSEGGGAQMFAIDIDGDGRNEVLTGQAAHGYGLVYYTATNAEATEFTPTLIMSDTPESSPTGVAVSQLHAMYVADMNGDGIDDIVTGKRWWAHANHDPGASEPAVLLWLETRRQGPRVQFVPHVVDINSGVGTQISVGDINGDGRLDILSGTKRGAVVFLQSPAASGDAARVGGTQGASPDDDRFQQARATDVLPVAPGATTFVPAVGERRLNLDFDAGASQDWQLRGSMASSIWQNNRLDSGSQRLDAIGEAISRPFVLAKPWIAFDTSGSGSTEARVEIVLEESGVPIVSVPGQAAESQLVAFDVSEFVGKSVRVRMVDHASDGYVTLDNVLLSEHDPRVE